MEKQGLDLGKWGGGALSPRRVRRRQLLGVLDAQLLLADDLGDGAGDAAYQGPVLLEADAPIFVLIQVADELVGRPAVPGVLGEGEKAESFMPGKAGWRVG